MRQIFSLLMVLGLSTSALAANTKVLASCLASYNESRTPAVPVDVIRYKGQLAIVSTFGACDSSICMSFDNTKLQMKSSNQEITAVQVRRTLGLTTVRNTLHIDLTTGLGVATHYDASESLIKSKKIYFKNCAQ